VSAQNLHVRAAYTSPAKLEDALVKGAKLGLLRPADKGAGAYHLTSAGRLGVQQLIETAYAAMASLQPLPHRDLVRLASLLQRLVEASLTAPEPPRKWCLRIARHFDPGDDAVVMERLDQYLSDLAAYRDDAHLAAWQVYHVSGQAWEAFTLLWRGTVKTLDELCAKLARRGFSREDYAAALQNLVDREWVVEDGGGYSLTERGRALRQDVESMTDSYFYEPWRCLDDAEIGELSEGLRQLRVAMCAALV
jgi:hypothetical protein